MSSFGDTPEPCDLAALYSLDALDDADRWDFRDHLVGAGDACASELEGFDEVVRVLAYAAEPASPPSSLRDRLMNTVAAPNDLPSFLSAAGDGASWEPLPIPGLRVRRLHVDRAARQAVVLVRADAGARYPGHTHAAAEEMFMLEGELRFGDRAYRAGDFIRSECGSVHESSETPGGCMFLLRASLDGLFGG